MKIAVDATVLWGMNRYSGVEKVVDRCVCRLLRDPRGHEFRVFVPSDWAGFEEGSAEGDNGKADASICRLPFPGSKKIRRILWQQIVFPLALRRWRADVVLCPAYVAPLLAPCPTILLVHDLHGLRLDRTRMENYLHHRIVLIPGIRRSAAVIATTRAVMEEIQPYLADGCRRIIAPLGVDTAFSPLPFESENQQAANPTTGNPTPGAGVSARDVPNLTSDERVSRFLHLHTHPFVLFVGNLERRKGLELLLDASALLHQSHPTLTVVMAGKDRGLREKLLKDIDRLKLCEVVILPGFVQAPDLLDLYRHAAVVVQPSLAEGFGIPPLEAMACGAPVVAVDSPALRENLGDAALFSAADATSLAGALARVLDDGSYRRRLIENGLRVSSHFTWERTTEAIRTAITG